MEKNNKLFEDLMTSNNGISNNSINNDSSKINSISAVNSLKKFKN
jgi:hypothetical protein